jgi:hypothetical protein
MMPAPETSLLTRAEDFHVPAGHLAVTVDLAPMPPSTVAIEAAKLDDVLNSLDLAFVGVSYHRVLAMFSRDFRKLKHSKVMPGLALVPFWLALRYPTGAEAVKLAVSDELRRTGSAHITVHTGVECGVAIAVAAGFVDLENSLMLSKKTGAAAVTVERAGMARERFQ